MRQTQSFKAALNNSFHGLSRFFLKERNGQIQAVIAILTLSASIFFRIRTVEWMVVLLCIGMVLSLEMINCAIEKLCDMVHAEYHPIVKMIKDVSAAGVLWASMISALVGALIFIPKLIGLFE